MTIDRKLFARKQQALVFDCYGILHAVKHGIQNKMSYGGQDTSIIYGFLNTVNRISRICNSGLFVFAWDSRGSLRKKQYPGYKLRKEKTAAEKAQDAAAFPQFQLVRTDVLPTIGWKNSFIHTGLEADDLIAHVVQQYGKDYNFTVISNDNDLLQLLDYCSLYSHSRNTLTRKQDFVAEWGIAPIDWATVKAIAGCTSDTVAGVKGVGEKTAVKHLVNALKPSAKATQAIVGAEGQAIIERNLPLVTLPLASPLGLELDFMGEQLSQMGFAEVCSKYGMQSFLEERTFQDISARWHLR